METNENCLEMEHEELLTDEEINTIFLGMMLYRHPDGVTEEEMENVVRWAESVRTNQLLLESVLAGAVLPEWKDGDVWFKLNERRHQNGH